MCVHVRVCVCVYMRVCVCLCACVCVFNTSPLPAHLCSQQKCLFCVLLALRGDHNEIAANGMGAFLQLHTLNMCREDDKWNGGGGGRGREEGDKGNVLKRK